jgi:hypothetical protein
LAFAVVPDRSMALGVALPGALLGFFAGDARAFGLDLAGMSAGPGKALINWNAAGKVDEWPGEWKGMRTLAAAILVMLPLAGCSGLSLGEEEDPPTALPALALPWGLTDCRFGVVLLDVPAAIVQAHVPEGFRVLSLAEVGVEGNTGQDIPQDPNGGGNFGIEVFQCDEGLGLDGPVEGLSYGSYFTAVEPPAELRRDVTFHFVKWDTLVPDAPRRALLQSYGLPVREGSATVTHSLTQGALTSYTGTLDFGGEETITFEGSSLAPQQPFTFVEFQRTPNGLATWSTTGAIAVGGVGPQTVTVPEAGLANDVVGAGVLRGIGFAGVATFSNGLIEAPARA